MVNADNGTNDGGPAFPRPCSPGTAVGAQEGMTLRDFFAAAALAGNLSRVAEAPAYAALNAYGFADAMLAERLKQ